MAAKGSPRCRQPAIVTLPPDRGCDDHGRSRALPRRSRPYPRGSHQEVRGFSERVDLSALLAYRDAVGRETRAWARDLDFDTLDAVPDLADRLAAAPPIVGERALWLLRFYTGKSGAFLLTFPIT